MNGRWPHLPPPLQRVRPARPPERVGSGLAGEGLAGGVAGHLIVEATAHHTLDTRKLIVPGPPP